MDRNRKGFTLIELLVVIAIIAMLLAIILPSLQAAKQMATGAVCVSHQKQLITAWVSYSADNNNFLVGGSNYYSGAGGTPYRWVEFPLASDKHNPEVAGQGPVGEADYTIETRKNGIRAGQLYTYAGNEELYHCPGDKTVVKNSEPLAVFRSYEISGLMNSEDFLPNGRASASDITSPIVNFRTAEVLPGFTKEMKVAVKDTDIRSPGNKMVFVEADVQFHDPYDKTQLGGWVLFFQGDNAPFGWWDWPAYYHKDSSTFSFADGHAEKHKWKEEDTIQLMRGEITLQQANLIAANNEDLLWLAKAYVPK